MFLSIYSAKEKRNYMYEDADQFFRAHLDENSLSPDRKTVYNYIKKPILEMQKKGVTYFPKFYQFLNKEVELNRKKVKELVIELDTVYLKIYFPEKTIKNMNVSDINAIISYAVFVSPTDTFYHILHYIYKVKRTDIGIYKENLNELTESVSNQITQSDENNEVYQPESIQGGEGGQINLNQRSERIYGSEADQFVNTQTETRPENIQNVETHPKDFDPLRGFSFEHERHKNTQNDSFQSVNMDNGETRSIHLNSPIKRASEAWLPIDMQNDKYQDDVYQSILCPTELDSSKETLADYTIGKLFCMNVS